MIKPILNWAETRDEKPISEDDLVAEYNSGSWMLEGENVITISQHLWKFLQMTVSGTAANTFASCSDLNGVDAWRALVWDVNRGRAGRMLKMHDGVHRPAGVRAYGEVVDLINRYVTNLNDFQAAGGTLPSDIEMKQALLRAFPQDLREALLLKATEPDSLHLFVAHVRTKVGFILHCRGQGSPAHSLEDSKAANVLDENAYNPDETEKPIDTMTKEELLALVGRMGGGRRPPGRFQSPAGRDQRAPPQRVMRCVNCGSDKHTRADCPKPEVPPEKRPCWKCGQVGHRSAQCKSSPGNRAANALEVGDAELI
jgi:hypothetical protein